MGKSGRKPYTVFLNEKGTKIEPQQVIEALNALFEKPFVDLVITLIPQTQKPFDYFEFDIKYLWVAEKRQSMQVLTVLDVNSRWNLGQYCAFDIKKEDVISLFDSLFESYDLEFVSGVITVANL